MVIIKTSAVAAIIHAVSPASIFDADACASAGVASVSNTSGARRARTFMACPPGRNAKLQRVRIRLPGADAQRVLDFDDKNLAVTDLAGLRRTGDRLDDALGA